MGWRESADKREGLVDDALGWLQKHPHSAQIVAVLFVIFTVAAVVLFIL